MLSPRTWFRPLTQQRPLEVGGENVSETQVQYSVVLDSLDRKGGWERGPGGGSLFSRACAHSFVLLVGENFPASPSPKILICFPVALITDLQAYWKSYKYFTQNGEHRSESLFCSNEN